MRCEISNAPPEPWSAIASAQRGFRSFERYSKRSVSSRSRGVASSPNVSTMEHAVFLKALAFEPVNSASLSAASSFAAFAAATSAPVLA